MLNKSLVAAFTVLFVLGHALPSFAEEKKSGSFFSGLRKPKAAQQKAKTEAEAKKSNPFQALFGGKTDSKSSPEGELTEEEKKLIKQVARVSGEESKIPRGPVKLPPPTQKVEPRTMSWAAPKAPTIARPPRNPNADYKIQVPQAPSKYLQLETPAAGPKISGDLKAPSTPNKKQN